jgi:DNA-binding MarR family transcriptional regulator
VAGSSATASLETFALLVADVYDAAGALRRFGERAAAAAGQTQARWQLMSVVSVGDWTVPMAADRLGTSRQAVQRIANELVDEGLAVLVDNPRHQRSAFVHLTADGTRVLRAITDQARRSEVPVLSQLESVDLLELRQNLRRLTRVVRSVLDSP